MQIPWQGRKPPVCENWDGGIQSCRTLAVSNEKAQKHAESGGALLRRRPPTPFTGIQDKLPQALSIKPARIFSHAFQQITHVAAVTIESGIAGSTLFAHPATERNQQGRIYNDLLYKSRRDKIGKPSIAEE